MRKTDVQQNNVGAGAQTAAAVLLMRLAQQGVEHLFGNAGTDFPPIIEAYAAAAAAGLALPQPVTAPHENLAVAMAHGAYLASGRPQAVMVHVSVGTANTVCGMLNANRETVPIVLLAGRSPVMEEGAVGARNAFIHWAQEMFDQSSIVREAVKWEYELRRADQAAIVADRAVSIAMTHPRGPVYVSLPREVLAEACKIDTALPPRLPQNAPVMPDTASIDRVAELLRGAARPVLITSSMGRSAREVEALERFALTHQIPVIAHRTRYMALSSTSEANIGYDIGQHLTDADLILVAESDVPWIPEHHVVNPQAKVVHLGFDPLFQRYPIRSFRAELTLAGDPASTLDALTAAASGPPPPGRRDRLAELRAGFLKQVAAMREASRGKPTAAWVASCLSEVMGDNDVLVTETAFPLGLMRFTRPGTYFAPPSAGGLGWGLGAGLGVKMVDPNRRVVTVVGDGAYMFGNPTPAHFVSAAGGWPTLTIILNNRMWAGVRRATLSLYPEGMAAHANDTVFTYLEPSPRYEKVVEASGGYGECVEDPSALPEAIERALSAAEEEGRQAVLNVPIAYSDDEAVRDAKR